MKNTVARIETLALPQQSNAKRIVSIGLVVLAVSVGTYVYFIGKIVFDVVARKTAEASIQSAQSSIGGLETSYLASIRTLDLAEAESMGLQESTDTLYASRDTAGSNTVGMAHEL